MKIGSIILYKNGKSFFSKAQHFFTGMPYNHVAGFIGTNELDLQEEFQADLQVRISSLDLSNCEIWEVNVSEDILKEELKKIIRLYEGKTYPFLQLLNFVRTWAFKKVGIDSRKFHQWLVFGVVCSQVYWKFLYNLALRLQWTDLINYLTEWDSNNYSAGDMALTVNKFPKYFKRI